MNSITSDEKCIVFVYIEKCSETHKFVFNKTKLLNLSPYFKSCFSVTVQVVSVTIFLKKEHGFGLSALNIFHDFINLGELDIYSQSQPELLIELVHLCLCFKCNEMMEHVEIELLDEVNDENASELLELALKFNLKLLSEESLKTINNL